MAGRTERTQPSPTAHQTNAASARSPESETGQQTHKCAYQKRNTIHASAVRTSGIRHGHVTHQVTPGRAEEHNTVEIHRRSLAGSSAADRRIAAHDTRPRRRGSWTGRPASHPAIRPASRPASRGRAGAAGAAVGHSLRCTESRRRDARRPQPDAVTTVSCNSVGWGRCCRTRRRSAGAPWLLLTPPCRRRR